MTHNVFGGTLNLAQSIYPFQDTRWPPMCLAIDSAPLSVVADARDRRASGRCRCAPQREQSWTRRTMLECYGSAAADEITDASCQPTDRETPLLSLLTSRSQY